MTTDTAFSTTPTLPVLVRGLTLIARRYRVTDPRVISEVAKQALAELTAGSLQSAAELAARCRDLLAVHAPQDGTAQVHSSPGSRFPFTEAEGQALRGYYVQGRRPEQLGLPRHVWADLKTRVRAACL